MAADISLEGLGLALGAVVTGWIKYRKEKKSPQTFCEVHNVVVSRLESGDKKFDSLLTLARKHGEILARLDERTKRL